MFNPQYGPWSLEDFSDSEGLTLGTYQTVTGGILSLLPLGYSSKSFTQRWAPVSGWSFTNSLNSVPIIESAFSIISGASLSGQRVPSLTAGYSQHVVSAGAWDIRTEFPLWISGRGFSGQEARALELSRNSLDSGWYNFFSNAGTDATLEIDVASVYDMYSGNLTPGFQTGQQNLTGLPALNGLAGHGIYIDNGANWDFLEINPGWIRSLNHPELAISTNFTQPKRIRIGLSNRNIFISTEDGRGVAGIGKFNKATLSGNDPKIAFGAPNLSGIYNKYPFFQNGISGFVGETFWDNVRVLYGKNVITDNTGNNQYYTVQPQTAYSNVYDPSININFWNSAVINHSAHKGGVTSVTIEYSGLTGWAGYATARLTGQKGPTSIDLTNLPVYSNSRRESAHQSISNPVRFRIDQASYGLTMPPTVDSIYVSASNEDALLHISPNWKPINQPITLRLAVNSGSFYDPRIEVDQYTTFLLEAPRNTENYTSSITGGFYESSKFSNLVSFSGTITNVPGSPSQRAIRNFSIASGNARTGSAAYSYFGTSYVSNFFTNAGFDNGFSLVTGFPQYVNNRSFGQLANGLTMVPGYTGKATIIYGPTQVSNPQVLAFDERINGVPNNPQQYSYVQSVVIPSNSFNGSHDASCGFEAIVPSGIASGNLLVRFDLQIAAGSGIQVYATGAVNTTPSWYLSGPNYRSYKNVSLPLIGRTGQINIGFIVPSGTLSKDYIAYNIDNLEVVPVTPGYLYSAGVQSYSYTGVIQRASLTPDNNYYPEVASTLVQFNTRIVSLPTGDNSILVRKYRTSDLKGYKIYTTQSGYLAMTLDAESKSRTTGSLSSVYVTGNLSTGMITDYQVPVGTWIDVGLVHQPYTYERLSYCNYSGLTSPKNFAASNRCYLLVNGSPVGVLDLERNWNNNGPSPLSPQTSMVCDGSGVLTICSGIYADIAGLKISRPIIADAEIDHSIKYSKVSLPYFTPPYYFSPAVADDVPNVLTRTSGALGYDTHIGSLYSFDGPGYTNWDHGPWRNHLIFYGTVNKSIGNPYGVSGLGCTAIASGSFALARYSSSTERYINTTGNLSINYNGLGTESGLFKVGGWVYPFNSGQDFFHIYKDISMTGDRISLGYSNSMQLTLSKRTSDTATTWSVTGSYSHKITGWNWVEAILSLGNYTGQSQTGFVSARLYSTSGVELTTGFTGVNYGFQYYGRSGTSFESCIVFGKTSTVALNDWFICPVPTGDIRNIADPTAIKSGRYQVLLKNNVVNPDQPSWYSYSQVRLPVSGGDPGNDFYSIAAHNRYDNFSRMNGGINLYDDQPFKNVPAYYLQFNTNPIDLMFGTNKSPIKIGNQVPKGAINLARVNSPAYDVDTSVSVVDLSYLNENNLSSFKDSVYAITKAGGTVTTNTLTGSFYGINSGLFSGRCNLSLSGQVHSKDINVTSVSIVDPNSSVVTEGFYCYLVGRGKNVIKIEDAYPHPTGQVNYYSSGVSIAQYTENLEKVKSAIKLKDSDGNEIPYESYPFNILTSPFTPDSLSAAIRDGISVNINGIGNYTGANYLSDGLFSVILLTNKRTSNEHSSVWIHYPSYDLARAKLDLSAKEIVNPIPIMRMAQKSTEYLPGRYSFDRDPDSLLYSVNIFGINSGYSNKL